ncbi:DUF4367 domain-containing protein [Thermosediminibacter litoriperuensis]|uniref:Uncharacterized protein DUF4367 n=1 Tax=Thermosediminibacter litoriperuensis TaxID=291989 RepID=A0A5S5AY15_9FIRM|nr:DUF4367 domain-containing protein [Thermosediminibacter litoriperuensis]TYP58768.1 uncharacterized protein DUF4367 [Thermosediminibacter litoriperuensis]
MKKDKDAFDLYLSKKVKGCAEDIPVPKHIEDETWVSIKKELEAKKHKQTNIAKRMVNAAFVLVVFFMGVYAGIAGKEVTADSKFFNVVRKYWNNVMTISGRTGGENYGTLKDVFIPIYEAQKNVHFQISVPEYLPEGYSFHGAKISGGGKDSVTLIYRKGTEGEELRIEQFSIARETAFSHNFRTNDAEVKPLSINGSSEATLIHFKKSGLRHLLYGNGSTYFIITGKLSEEDIIRVAESMRT